MARVLVRVTERILKESKADTTGVSLIMADYDKVKKEQQFAYYVEQAYMKGLITGTYHQGSFAGDIDGKQ